MKYLSMLIGLLFLTVPVRASAIDENRLLYIDQPITRTIAPVRDGLVKMAAESKSPITIVINSPGGSVVSGMGFINDMRNARAMGVELNCYVLDMAASMAFQILTECNNRYAMKTSYLLWHGVRTGIDGILTAQTAAQLAKELERMDKLVLDQLVDKLHLSYSDILYHFNAETLWYGYQLADEDPRFIKVSNAFPEVVSKLGKAVKMKQPSLLDLLFGEQGDYIYMWSKYYYLLDVNK